ncbi:glycoside hydrolase family 97 protein [Plebeiibacterium marinum]|uniref:Glycoside hydrolase family 97 protein n=1 Tax=Plebeiibacterium marinum TaxID=2992111 RepID=A0AAE3MG73_9BACT|nr:glycoside hydrolase family 97 protein [Plebeiobacterium marinum]MCW3807146.1 glycoside hydrolase family 97 protein [Plebeiobacterium marinum]
MKNSVGVMLVPFLFFCLMSCLNQTTDDISVSSPDSALKLKFHLKEGRPYYELMYKSDTLINLSALGFELKEQPAMKGGFKILDTEISSHNENWQMPWGQNKRIVDNHNLLKVELQETSENPRLLTLYFKIFNDGAAFRYEFPEQKNLKEFVIMDEITEFNINGNPDTWWIQADYDTYEKLYQKTTLHDALWVATPVTMKTVNNTHVSIHEAALTDYAGMTLKQTRPGVYKSELVPWANGDKVRCSAPMKTPWRTIQVSPNAAELVESNMILNLNEPSKIEDPSWIQPMKYIGIWWGMHLGTEIWHAGSRHGATTQNTMDHIDFAAAHNVQAVVVEGWNAGWENWGGKDAFDHVTPARDYDLEKVAAYAKEKGVMIIGHHETGGDIPAYEHYVDSAFKQCDKLGIHAVKTGYAGGIYPRGEHHHGQFMVRHYRKIVELAAKYHIVLDAHEPIKPTGIRRTWPNMMTREGVRGMEWNAWSEGNPPSHTVTIPFTRGLGGPTDYTPGTFDLLFKDCGKRVPWNTDRLEITRTHSTLAKQLANFVILYSPLQMASDLPKNYEGHPAFQFFVDFNADVDESKILNGEVGEYITTVRRAGDNWYLGSATNEKERDFKVDLSFLNPGSKYKAVVYKDAPDSDWKTNPYAYEIDEIEVDAAASIEIKLAPGGGQAIYFVKL